MQEKPLLRLIRLKESITNVTPDLETRKWTVNVEEGNVYEREVILTLPQHQAFFCYVYSEKGLVIPAKSWYDGKGSFRIPIHIKTMQMIPHGNYEDRLYMIFPGTYATLDVTIRCIHKPMPVTQPSDYKPLSLSTQQEPVQALFSKETYTTTEQIVMHLVNKTKDSVKITLNHEEGIITPSYIDMFITNAWKQEWFVKKNTLSRMFGRLSFQESPFEIIHLSMGVHQDDQLIYHQDYTITMTRYDAYKTPYYIDSQEDYGVMRIAAFQQMREGRMLRNMSTFQEGLYYAYASLNYNQKDYTLRRTVILMLTLIGAVKERDEELAKVMKYQGYYEKMNGFDDVLSLYKRQYKNSSFMRIMACQESRIRMVRYDAYKTLYEEGERSWILFAEAIGLLNQSPHIPTKEDRFYGVCLHMALNRGCVSKDWQQKIDRHYYVLQKQRWMSSNIGFRLHEYMAGDNMMKMLCYLCIREKRYDARANYVYREGIKKRLYIQDLEHYYYYSVWKGKEHVDVSLLSPATKLRILPDDIQCYIFTAMLEEGESMAHLIRHWSKHIEGKLIKWIKEERDVEELSPFISFCYDYWWESQRQYYDMYIRYIRVEWAVEQAKKLKPSYEEAIMKSLIVCGYGEHPAIPLVYYTSSQKDPCNQLLLKMASAPFIPEIKVEYPAYRESIMHRASKETQQVFFREMARWVVVEDVQLPSMIMEDMLYFYESGLVWDTGILYALIHYEQERQGENRQILQKLLKDAENHDIMVPYHGDYVYYMTHPRHDMTIAYRYPEMDTFEQRTMQRSEFGIFYAKVTLFYDEVMEYYLIETNQRGEQQIVYSDRFIKTEVHDVQNGDEGFNHREEVIDRLDQLAVALDVDDIKGIRILIQEQRAFESQMHQLNRI